MDISALEAKYGSLTPVKKKKNFFLDQISTVGGIAGGIAGMPLGILGVGGGAAAGSGLGEAIENTLSGEKITNNVGKEAAIGGVFGSGPIKLAKAATGVVRGSLAKESTDQLTRTALQRGSQGFLGGAWGIKTGAKVGSDTLTPQRARELQSFITKEVGVPRTANADMVAERLVNFRKLAGQNIDDIVKTSDRTLSPQESSTLLSKVGSKIGSLAGVDTASPIALRLTQQLGEQRNLSGLIKFRRSLDEAINFARNPASPDPVTERLAKTMRSEIDSVTSKLIPGLKNANSQYSRATKSLDYVLPAAKNPKGLSIFGNPIGGGVAQRGRSAIGQMGGSPPPPGALPANPTRLLGKNSAIVSQKPMTGRGIAGRIGAGSLITGTNSEQPTSLEDALLQQDPNMGTLGYPDMEEPTEQSPYSRVNLMADIQRDPQNADKYIEYYAQLEEVFAQPKEKPLSAMAAKTMAGANSGLASLAQLEEFISKSGVPKGTTVPGRGLFGGAGQAVLGTAGFDAAADNVADNMVRARTGAAATREELQLYRRLLPQAFDSPEVQAQKTKAVRDYFSSISNMTGRSGSLEDAILEYQ